LARRAAEKYQWVIDSGVSNPQLYFNLGNAYFKSGQTGRAIANYHRAIRLEPANRRYHQHLQFAQSTLPTSNSDADQMSADLPTRLKRWTDLALQHVSATSMGITALACWCMVWGIIALRLLHFQFPWKSLVALALTIFVFTGGMFGYWVNKNFADHAAIVVAGVVELRAGDGENFPQVVEIDNSEGMTVRVLHRRGQWAQVRTKSGRTGWLPLEQLEII
jgi:tetratricopeptide (TPR) repeat protein